MSSTAIYCRSDTSTNDRTTESQLARTRHRLEMMHGESPAVEFVDFGVSGLQMNGGGLAELLRHCAANPGTTVLIDTPDRLGRNFETVAHVLKSLAEVSAKVLTADGDHVDLHSAFGAPSSSVP